MIAWGVAAVSIGLAWSSLAREPWFGIVFGAEDRALILPGLLGGTAFAVVGALIAARTGNAVGWMFLGIAGFASIPLPAQNWFDAAEATTRQFPLFAVADDGAGFAATSTSHGTGLQGLADRLGGNLVVDNKPGVGTTVADRVPVSGSEAGA